MLATLSVVSIALDKTGTINTGYTMLATPFTFSATVDTIGVSDTVTYTIGNAQKYYQHFTFTVALAQVTITPSVVITAYGKVTASGAWVAIGSAITWTTTANNGSITSTTPANYNYLKVEFISSAAAQKTKITAFEVKTANMYDIPANSGTLTISRATTGTVTVQVADDNANAAAIYRAGGTGALTLGASTGTTAITSSDWAISTAGAMTGIGAITADGLITSTAGETITGAAVNLNASSNYAVNVGTGTSTGAVSIGGGSNTVAVNSTTWDITSAGVFTGMLRSVLTDATGTKALAATDANCVLFCTASGGATTVTIPDPSASSVGVIYYVIQTADQNLIVTATTANGNSIVCDGVATSDNVTISTASHKIGAGMIIVGLSATQWFVGGLNPESLLTPEAAD